MTHIWIPRAKIIEPKEHLSLMARCEGFFSLEAVNRYGHVRRSHEWQQLITDTGLNFFSGLGGGSSHGTFAVGTGTNPPAFGNTQLQTQVAAGGSIVSQIDTNGTAPDYWAEFSQTQEFPLGSIIANLTEVGCGNLATTLAYRDLIRDGGGSPTTFPVTVNDQLRVTHRTRVYPPVADVAGSFTVTGVGTINTTVRPSGLLTGSGVNYVWRGFLDGFPNRFSAAVLYNSQTLGAVTGGPAGTPYGSSSASSSSYVNGNFYQDRSFVWGLTSANDAAGLGALLVGNGATHGFQVGFDTRIFKFAGSVQRILTLNMRVGWGRFP